MKRDSNIIPLSRDHHYGLLFCWKVRQGINMGIDPDRIRLYVLDFWKTHLEQHFREEETLLFQDVPDPLCLRAIEEHRRIHDLVVTIRDGGGWVKTNYTMLADLLDKHIRFEEREVFPFLEQRLTAERLTEVGVQLNRLHEQPADDLYEDAFWS